MARFTDSQNDYILNGIATPDTDNAAANKAYVDAHPGTTYSTFSQDTDGLVPGPNSTESNPGYSLRGDGSWAAVPVAPGVFDGTSNGLVNATGANNDGTRYLGGDGAWRPLPDTDINYAEIIAIVGSIDAWITDTDTTVISNLNAGLMPGQIKLAQFSSLTNTTVYQPNTGQLNRIIVAPPTGSHATLFSEMQPGSPIKVEQGSHEFIAAVSSISVTGNPAVYTLAFNTPDKYYTSNSRIDSDDPVTFYFRPTREAPVVRGDIQPNTIIAQDVNGGELSPYHMELDRTGTPSPRAEGYVPVSGGTAINAGWSWQQFDPLGSAEHVNNELLAFEEVVHDGIGAIPVIEDSDLRRPREFTSINFEREGTRVTGVTFGYLAKDEQSWLDIQTFFDSEGEVPYAGQDVTVHMQTSYKPTATDTELSNIDFFINTTEPASPGMVLVDTDSDTVTFRINTASAGNVIALDDTHGNATSIPASDFTGGNGYWRNIHIFTGIGEREDLTAQFATIGDPVFNYDVAYNTVIPVIRDNDDQNTPNIRLAGLGTGLTYDSDNNVINASAAGGTGITVSGTLMDDSHPNTTEIRFPGASIVQGSGGAGHEDIHLPNIANYGSLIVYYPGQLVRDSGNDDIYMARFENTSVPAGTALTDTVYWTRLVDQSAHQGDGWSDSDIASLGLDFNASNQLTGTLTTVGSRTITSTSTPTPRNFSTSRAGFVPSPIDTEGNINYYLSGNGTWQHVHNGVGVGIFTDSDNGLVPASGGETGTQFLADTGRWENPGEYIDSEHIIPNTNLNLDYYADRRALDLDGKYRIPAVPHTGGQRAVLNVRIHNNPTTNGNDDQPLESSATMTLRGRTETNGTTDINVRWGSNDVVPGHGSRGMSDVATIFAQAIGQNFPGVMEVVDFGVEGTAEFTVQMVHDGPIDTDNPGSSDATALLREFDSVFYTMTASYPNVISTHGNSGEYDGGKAPGSLGTNGRDAKDTEKVFSEVVLPLVTQANAGLVAGWGTNPSQSHLAPGGWTPNNTIDRETARDVIEKVDAYGKIDTEVGMYWNSDGTLNRTIVSVPIGGSITSDSTFTKGLFWETNDGQQRLSSVQYHFGSHAGTGAFGGGNLVATKTLHWNESNQLTGTTIS